MSHKDEWKEIDSVTRSAGWRAGVWIIVGVVFFGLLGGLLWMFGVFTSDIKGKGEQVKIVNDAQNRTQAQEWFVAQYQLIQSTDAKLDGMKEQADAALDPSQKAILMSAFTGTKSRCLDMVAAYNAETQKVSKGKWLDASLPFSIDTSDPKFDCKETVR